MNGVAGLEPRPTRAAVVWLMVLGVLFFTSYNAANWLAGQRAAVPSIVFAWEAHMPYWPWTLVPYWSIDLFYCASLFVCRTRGELRIHVARLLSAQLISVTIFVVAPLRFSGVRPALAGSFQALQDALLAFDHPYNQAPALHISLLVILWLRFAPHLQRHRVWRALLYLWFTLIGISVLTTYQHHFFDVPAGAWTGLLCAWLFPEHGPALFRNTAFTRDPRRRQLAGRYAVSALVPGVAAVALGGWALWLLWAAGALLLVALNYGWFGAAGFQKGADGRLTLASRLLFAPYTLSAWLNARWWTRSAPAPCAVTPHLWLVRLPGGTRDIPPAIGAVVDLCAELPCPATRRHYTALPALDLVPLDAEALAAAARAIAAAQAHGPVLVCCALGYARSAAAIAAWLIVSGEVVSVEAAVARLRAAQPAIVIGRRQYAALEMLACRG